jgi:hypothetical protein
VFVHRGIGRVVPGLRLPVGSIRWQLPAQHL